MLPEAEQSKTTKELEELINAQILRHYTEFDSKGRFPNRPKTDEELVEFVELAYSCFLPKKVVIEGHRTAKDFLCDMFFERTKNALGFASRASGKTFAVAILNHIDMVFKPGCEIAHGGAVRTQARQCYKYFLSFNNLPWFKDLNERWTAFFGRPFLKKENVEQSEFDNGSTQTIITATEKGLRSPHPNKVRLDEIDLVDWDQIMTAMSMVKSSPGIRGQQVFTSTRQNERGTMQRMLDCAAEKGIEIYEWNIWETVEKCPRRCQDDPEFGNCPIYEFCQGRAHHSDGFFPIEDFIDKARVIDKEHFEIEWENKKPLRNRLVYSTFDNTKHVVGPRELHVLTGHYEPSPTWNRICGIDFGSGPEHPFVYLKLAQMPNGAWLLFHEYYQAQRLMRDHAKEIKKSPYYRRHDPIYSDHAGQERLELKHEGIYVKLADKKERLAGIDYVASLITGFPPEFRPQLYIWHECQKTIEEFSLYRWITGADGKPCREDVVKVNDHCMDALRYALVTHKKHGAQRYRAWRMDGI